MYKRHFSWHPLVEGTAHAPCDHVRLLKSIIKLSESFNHVMLDRLHRPVRLFVVGEESLKVSFKALAGLQPEIGFIGI
jgi:hypothetical protein